ncbi:DUF2334 domain-containing protein [Jongsikchunia kroppenstedtii]|uniref:DUF2334 domain-containing protein n=1 Tax=Jongsikchunia kroppenstedtii TaxID=1121721 RepID=UPI00037B4A65|nr:DUF2334 domain-containing protein [Jongsikchunia kroppenstedtii]
MTGQLIVSVSGIRAETLQRAQEFVADLDRREIPVSLLVSPRLKHGYRLADDRPTVDWLRERRAGDDAIVLHGYDQAPTKRRRAEFAVIDAHEARLRLTAADRVLEQTGLRTRIFAAPRWSASPGAVQALLPTGFRANLGFTSMQNLAAGTAVRARVLGFGDGFPDEAWWCRMVVMNTNRVARRGGVVRLSVAAKHLSTPLVRRALLNGIDLAVHHGATPATYRGFTAKPVIAAA